MGDLNSLVVLDTQWQLYSILICFAEKLSVKLLKSLNDLTCTYKEVSTGQVECQLIPWQSG